MLGQIHFIHMTQLNCPSLSISILLRSVSAELPIVDIDSLASAVPYTVLTTQKAYSIFQ